ncbi:MAG: hypothetical protein ACKOTB_19475 [Planctomycetia bacterium]
MLTLLAAGFLQRFGDLLVAGAVLALAAFGYQNGLFLAVLAGMHALATLVAALAFADPLAALLVTFEVPAGYAFPAAFGLLAVGVAVAIRLAVGAYVPADVLRFAPGIDKLGGGLVGGLAGSIVAGIGLIAFSVAPVPDALRIDGTRLNYDLGTRMLRMFARCVEPDAQKRQILLDGEPSAVVPPPPPPPQPLFQEQAGQQAADAAVPHESDGDQSGDPGSSASQERRTKRERQRKSQSQADKPAPPPPPPPPPPPTWSEPFADTNGNKSYDEGEPFLDTDGDGAFTLKLVLNDTNGNGQRDIGLLERYRMRAWGRQVISAVEVGLPADVPPPAAAPPK